MHAASRSTLPVSGTHSTTSLFDASAFTAESALRIVAPWLGTDLTDRMSLGTTISSIRERDYREHEHVFLEGEKRTHVYLVLSGVVGIYKLLGDGRRHICTFSYPGDLIGLDCTEYHVDCGEALCGTRLRCIPANLIAKLILSEPGFGQTLLKIVAIELAETRERMLALSRQSATEKLAGFLLRASRRNADADASQCVVRLPMKRSEIADFLGLTIETVSRNFTRLKVAGVIHLRSTCEVHILDPERLKAIALGEQSLRLSQPGRTADEVQACAAA